MINNKGDRVLDNYTIALNRIREAHKTAAERLDLKGLELVKLPPEIGLLTQLTELDLGGNQLSELSPEIGLLTQLTKLNLWGNRLSELSPEIGLLTQLTELNLWRNQLSELPPEIGLLTQLTKLNLGGNPLSELPPEIGLLTQLTKLNLWSNQLSELSPEIGLLTQLTELDLWNNQLSELPPEIGLLTQLTKLNLWGNRLSELSPEIGLLTQLTELNLWRNQLSELPPEIGLLTQLMELNLGDNQLSRLPPEIALLTQLTELVLHSNQLSQLTTLKPLIVTHRLQIFTAFNNPIVDIPHELLGNSGDPNISTHLAEYWQALERDKDSISNQNAKCLLVGNALVGKTTLAHCLINGRPPAKPIDKQDRTPGIIIEAFELHSDDQEKVTIQLWDMGGQELYHATHRLFLQQHAPYLLVWSEDVESMNKQGFYPITYWYDMVRHSAGNSPIILIKNKIDCANHQAHPAVDKQALRFTQTLELSAQQGTHLAALKGQLQDLYFKQYRASWCYPIPGSWQRLRNALDKQRQKHKALSFENYKQLCRQLKVKYQETALLYLHNSGHVFYQRGLFKNQIILDQNWLIKKVYSLFEPLPEPGSNRRVIEEEQRGYFKGYQTQQFWPEHPDQSERKLLISYMRSCYMLIDVAPRWESEFNEREYLVPALLPKTPSSMVGVFFRNKTNRYRLVMRYPFLHQGHFERLMASFLSRQRIPRDRIWRSGILLNSADEQSWVLLEIAPDYFKANQGHAYTLGLTVTQPGRQSEFLENILLMMGRTLVFAQPDIFISVNGEQFVSLDAVNTALNKRQTQVACTDHSIVKLSDYLPITRAVQNTDQQNTKERWMTAKPIQLFLSYAHHDQTLVTDLHTRLQKKFKLAKDIQIETWHDGKIALGKDWHKDIQAALDHCDYGLLMVSEDFLISDYIGEHELPNLMEQDKVLPVCLKHIDFQRYDLKGLEKHQFFSFEKNSFTRCETEQDKEAFAHALFVAVMNRIGVDGAF